MARSVVGLVLGYVTSVVVDLAILIEVFLLNYCHATLLKSTSLFRVLSQECSVMLGLSTGCCAQKSRKILFIPKPVAHLRFCFSQAKSAQELPEYLLGTVRINRIKIDQAVRADSNSLDS